MLGIVNTIGPRFPGFTSKPCCALCWIRVAASTALLNPSLLSGSGYNLQFIAEWSCGCSVRCVYASVTPACLHWAVPPALSSLLRQLLLLGQARVQPEKDAKSPCRSPAPPGSELKHAFPAHICFLRFKSIFVSNHGSCWLQIQHQKQRQQPYRDCLPSSCDSMGWIPMINPLFSVIQWFCFLDGALIVTAN